MSQQTVMAALLPKYVSFLKALPTVAHLASCDEGVLRELWSGLGYYARARYLKQAAQIIVHDKKGVFPSQFSEWLQLPGCGPYTAAMLASVCFGECVPAVDGNIIRVVSRLCAVSEPWVWSPKALPEFVSFLTSFIDAHNPGDFNQALMELGATVCRKKNPHCSACPLMSSCLAYQQNKVEFCPPLKPRKDWVAVSLVVAIFKRKNGMVAVLKRSKGFLKNTEGFPIYVDYEWQALETKLRSFGTLTDSGSIKHTITNHKLSVRVMMVELFNDAPIASLEADLETMRWVAPETTWGTSFDQKVFQIAMA